jgi:peptidyl-prolyl cis-trans isomerase C
MKQMLFCVAIACTLIFSACHFGGGEPEATDDADATPFITDNGSDNAIPQYVADTAVAAQILLMRDVVDFLKQNPVTDADLQVAYDAFVAEMGDREYKLRHILLKTEQEAQDVIAKLRSEEGVSFAKLAKQYSIDMASKYSGGSLDWNVPLNLPIRVGNALKDVEKGQYTTTPVQTSAGYHVILVEGIRPFVPPALDVLKPRLEESVMQLKMAKFVDVLKQGR